jgi:hypothetical protein
MLCYLQDESDERPLVDSDSGCAALTPRDRATSAGKAANTNDGRSQTQPETQLVADTDTRPKRKSREEQLGRAKRVKISLGDAMDLGD